MTKTPERIVLCVWPNDAVHVEDASCEPKLVTCAVWRAWYVRADVVERLEARVRELETKNEDLCFDVEELKLAIREERMGSDA